MQPEPSPPVAELLDRADAICADRGARLTALRRRVLGLVLQSDAPIGAYDLLARLRDEEGKPAAPPTIYRALEFLLEQGLIHRLERLSAYVGCVGEADMPGGHTHKAQFLICRVCGRVAELDDHELTRALETAAARAGFTITSATIEAEGLCEACRTGPLTA